MREWISVKDRLPEESKKVLISNGPHVEMGFLYQGKWILYMIDDVVPVSHWMPLPEPPT